jgi:hypothetical protein
MYCLDSECIECPGCWSEHAASRVPQQQRLRPLPHVYGETFFLSVFFLIYKHYVDKKDLFCKKNRFPHKKNNFLVTCFFSKKLFSFSGSRSGGQSEKISHFHISSYRMEPRGYSTHIMYRFRPYAIWRLIAT